MCSSYMIQCTKCSVTIIGGRRMKKVNLTQAYTNIFHRRLTSSQHSGKKHHVFWCGREITSQPTRNANQPARNASQPARNTNQPARNANQPAGNANQSTRNTNEEPTPYYSSSESSDVCLSLSGV
jgi:hypothetical protein